jgi:hypothetical protein
MEPKRGLKLIQYPPTLPSSQESQSHQGEWKNQANKNGINPYKAQITHPSRRLGCGEWAAGCKKLPDGHEDQNPNEKSKPDKQLRVLSSRDHPFHLFSF